MAATDVRARLQLFRPQTERAAVSLGVRDLPRRMSGQDVHDPVAYCGVYHNPEDGRVCVCARDPAQCGKKVCAPNLATAPGKVICALYVVTLITVPIIVILNNQGHFDTE